jgi:hypothetical protein
MYYTRSHPRNITPLHFTFFKCLMPIRKVKVPVGKSGKREVKRFFVSETEASLDRMRCAFN